MKKAKPVLRMLLGLIYFVFGLNFFLHFIPIPSPASPAAQAFMGGLFGSGYFFLILKVTEVVGGALLLANMFVPLVLIILAPITLNIFLYHTMLDTSGAPLAILIALLHIGCGYFYFNYYKPLMKKKNA